MATLGIAKDKAPAGVLSAVRSDGETIPWIAVGGEQVGDVINRVAAETTQSIGVVSSLGATRMTQGVASANPTTDAAAVAGDEIQLRIYGMFYMPVVDGTYADGALLTWNGTAMEANTTGAHEVVGSYVSGDTHALIRINQLPRAEFVPP